MKKKDGRHLRPFIAEVLKKKFAKIDFVEVDVPTQIVSAKDRTVGRRHTDYITMVICGRTKWGSER